MMPRRRKRFSEHTLDFNITPFMNLMAVLTPFLLATAVFTRLAVLEIYLPPETGPVIKSSVNVVDQLVLTITITERGLIVANSDKIISFIAATQQGYDFKTLSNILQELKRRYPDEENAIILSTPMISYGSLVAVMDMTRTMVIKETGARLTLFPNISLGEVQ